MKKYLKVMLVIEVEDLSVEQRKQAATDCDCKVRDLTTVKDISPAEIADILIGTPSDDYDPRFEGTDKYAQFGGYLIQHAMYMDPKNLSKREKQQIKTARNLMRPPC